MDVRLVAPALGPLGVLPPPGSEPLDVGAVRMLFGPGT